MFRRASISGQQFTILILLILLDLGQPQGDGNAGWDHATSASSIPCHAHCLQLSEETCNAWRQIEWPMAYACLVGAMKVLHVFGEDVGGGDVAAAPKPPSPRQPLILLCLKVPMHLHFWVMIGIWHGNVPGGARHGV